MVRQVKVSNFAEVQGIVSAAAKCYNEVGVHDMKHRGGRITMREHKNFWDRNAGRYDRFMQKTGRHTKQCMR